MIADVRTLWDVKDSTVFIDCNPSFAIYTQLALAAGISSLISATTPIPMTVTIFYMILSIVVSGGIGITRRGFLAFDALVDDAHRLISECPCEKGCPSCVQSPKCGNLNEPLSKLGSAQLMGRMLAS